MQPTIVKGYWSLCAIRFSTSVVAWVDFILIFSTLSFVFEASTSTIGLAAAFYGLPSLVLGPLAGRLADKVNPFGLVMLSFLVRAAASSMLFLASDLNAFLVFVLFKGISNLGAVPAEVVLTRQLLDDRQIVGNTALVSTVNQFIKVCSPLAAGLVVASSERPIGFLLSAACAVAGMLFCGILWGLQGRGNRGVHQSKPKVRGGWAAIKLFYQTGPTTRLLLFCTMAQSAVLGFYDSMLGTLLRSSGLGAGAFGLVVSATGLGGILAGVLFKSLYPARVMLCSTVSLWVYGACILGSGLIVRLDSGVALIGFAALFFVSGIAFGLPSMAFAVALQTRCAPGHLGFISSSVWSLTLALLVSGPVLGGFIAGLTSIASAFLVAGAVAMVVSVALHLSFGRAAVASEDLRDMPQKV